MKKDLTIGLTPSPANAKFFPHSPALKSAPVPAPTPPVSTRSQRAAAKASPSGAGATEPQSGKKAGCVPTAPVVLHVDLT